jgi:hypothetical protein
VRSWWQDIILPQLSTELTKFVGMGLWDEIERLMGVSGVIVEEQEVEDVPIGVRT